MLSIRNELSDNHILEGELSELPDGCPVCGADVDKFTEESW